jgi:hypothetical protein
LVRTCCCFCCFVVGGVVVEVVLLLLMMLLFFAAFISVDGRAVDAWQELVVVVVGIAIRITF